MFRREQHRVVADLLSRLDGDLLAACGCCFAGGTAISLQLGEYRRSDDIDFVCASVEGYRTLRERVFDAGLAGLARGELPVLREPRTDQYGVRAVLGSAEAPVKFEIVREARIALAAAPERLAGVPLLSRVDLYAEKLLANADRGLDAATLHRDLIDLCVMVRRWGAIPAMAADKARAAYGHSIDRAFERVAARLREQPAERQRCLEALQAEADVAADVEAVLASASLAALIAAD